MTKTKPVCDRMLRHPLPLFTATYKKNADDGTVPWSTFLGLWIKKKKKEIVQFLRSRNCREEVVTIRNVKVEVVLMKCRHNSRKKASRVIHIRNNNNILLFNLF